MKKNKTNHDLALMIKQEALPPRTRKQKNKSAISQKTMLNQEMEDYNSSLASTSDPEGSGTSNDDERGPAVAATSLHAWVDIFATSKLIISISPRSTSNPFLTIHHAQQEFFLNFGFTEDRLPMPLSQLFGITTERSKVTRLENCLLSGRSFSEFMNLHNNSGGSLSCYVTLLCLTNHVDNHNHLDYPSYSTKETIKYGVLTILSASVVGNSKYSGIGLMGTERVPRERFQEPSQGPPSTTNFPSYGTVN